MGQMRMELALGMLAAIGCGTTGLSARGRQVLTLAGDPGPDCAELGAVAGSADPFFGGLQPDERLLESARHDAVNQAARAGATHIKFTGTPQWRPSGTFGGGKEVSVTGVAYRCGAPSSSRAGCTKDTDCKGDRICESGTCIDPRGARAPAALP